MKTLSQVMSEWSIRLNLVLIVHITTHLISPAEILGQIGLLPSASECGLQKE